MHVLSTPPAFILSQDQTLMLKVDRSSDYLAWLIYPKPSLLGFCSEFSQIQRSKPDLLFLEFSGFVYNSVFNFKGTSKLAFRNAEGGIWTLAPLLTTYSLSRGAPSTTWVLLLGWSIMNIYFQRHLIAFALTERVGFEPTRPFGQTVFKTASLWPLRYLSKRAFQFYKIRNVLSRVFLFIFLVFFLFSCSSSAAQL